MTDPSVLPAERPHPDPDAYGCPLCGYTTLVVGLTFETTCPNNCPRFGQFSALDAVAKKYGVAIDYVVQNATSYRIKDGTMVLTSICCATHYDPRSDDIVAGAVAVIGDD